MLKSIFVLLIHSINHLQLLLLSLKPSSSTHSLQIYCIGLAGLEFTYPLGIVLKPSPYNWRRLWEELGVSKDPHKPTRPPETARTEGPRAAPNPATVGHGLGRK